MPKDKKKKRTGVLLAESALRKRYQDSGLASSISLTPEKTLVLPCRVPAINYQLGGGAFYGKIIELFGEESTGKTLLAIDFAYTCQQLGGMVLWNDAECCFSQQWALKNGLDLKRIELLKDENEIETVSDWIADMIVYYRSKLINNEPILLIGDSIAAWDTKLNMETPDVDSKVDMGRRSKAIYQMLRKRRKLLSKYGVTTIFINQLRKKVGATQWEDPDTTPGGMAMRFYADIRIGLYRGKKITNVKKQKVGQVVYIRTKKNKLAPPRDNIQAEVYFKKSRGNLGYSKYHYLSDTLVEAGVVERKNARFYFEGNKIAHGDTAFIDLLNENQELRAKLLAKLGVNTPSSLRKKMGDIGRNLYPVKAKTVSND